MFHPDILDAAWERVYGMRTEMVVSWLEVGTWGPTKGLLGEVSITVEVPEPYQFMENWTPSYMWLGFNEWGDKNVLSH